MIKIYRQVSITSLWIQRDFKTFTICCWWVKRSREMMNRFLEVIHYFYPVFLIFLVQLLCYKTVTDFVYNVYTCISVNFKRTGNICSLQLTPPESKLNIGRKQMRSNLTASFKNQKSIKATSKSAFKKAPLKKLATILHANNAIRSCFRINNFSDQTWCLYFFYIKKNFF